MTDDIHAFIVAHVLVRTFGGDVSAWEQCLGREASSRQKAEDAAVVARLRSLLEENEVLEARIRRAVDDIALFRNLLGG